MNAMFLLQSKGTKITHVGGILLSKEDLLDKEYFSKIYSGGVLRYASPRGYFNDTKSMSLKEFEEIFSKDLNKMSHLLKYDSSKGAYTNTLFRREILNKYGVDSCDNSIKDAKHITKLKEGHIYKDKNGITNWLYLGNIVVVQTVNNVTKDVLNGNCFIRVSMEISLDVQVRDFFIDLAVGYKQRKCHFLKGKKAVIEDLGHYYDVDKILSKEITGVIPKSYLSCVNRTVISTAYRAK